MTPGFPWNCRTNENGYLTFAGWSTLWELLLRCDAAATLRWLVLLGWDDEVCLLYVVTKPKQEDWRSNNYLRRHVVHAFAFGDSAVGKVRASPPSHAQTSLLQRLLASKSTPAPTETLSTVVAPVSFSTDNLTTIKKTLLFSEVPVGQERQTLREMGKACDIACSRARGE